MIQSLIPGSQGVAFASAMVVEDTLWVFGTNDAAMDGGKSRTQVHVFSSNDPTLATSSWKTAMILQLVSVLCGFGW